MPNISLPENVAYIINVLQAAGYEAYAVGGCVRDSILGNEPDDWDITTSALPEQVKSLFSHTIDTGIRHGTVTIMMHGTGYEVTTYRIDGDYHDGRHPDSVAFTASLEEDLKRRDFTINAFVYNNKNGIIDLFDGLSDLKNGIIRCVGNPHERFTEDALRILRALRFAARFSFSIEADTLRAAEDLSGRLSLVSAERIQCELDKLLVSSNPDYILLLNSLSIDKVILPELDDAVKKYGSETIKTALRSGKAEHCIRWAVLCHFLDASPDRGTVAILRRLKFDNRTIGTVSLFVRNAARALPCYRDFESDNRKCMITVRYLLHDIGYENMPDFLNFRKALDSAAGNNPAETARNYTALENACSEIIEAGQCTCLKELAINGRDLINSGFAGGEALGTLLEHLLDEVIRLPEQNTRERLLELAALSGINGGGN